MCYKNNFEYYIKIKCRTERIFFAEKYYYSTPWSWKGTSTCSSRWLIKGVEYWALRLNSGPDVPPTKDFLLKIKFIKIWDFPKKTKKFEKKSYFSDFFY